VARLDGAAAQEMGDTHQDDGADDGDGHAADEAVGGDASWPKRKPPSTAPTMPRMMSAMTP